MPIWNQFNTHRFTNSQTYTQCNKTSMFHLLKYPKLPAAYIRHGSPAHAAYRSAVFSSFAKQSLNRGTTVLHIYTALTADIYQASYLLTPHRIWFLSHIYLRGNSDPIFYLEFRQTEQERDCSELWPF